MPRNGSGVYTLPVTYEATTGATATAEQHNEPLEDIRDDLNAARPVVAGGTGSTSAAAARAALGVTARLDGTTEITPDLGDGTKFEGTAITGRPLTNEESNTLTKGFRVTPHDNSTITSGTLTPDALNQNVQKVTNNGAHTLAAPANDCTIVLKYTNAASAGTVTFSGFNVTPGGDPLTTTNGNKFFIYITVVDGDADAVVRALQ